MSSSRALLKQWDFEVHISLEVAVFWSVSLVASESLF